MESAESSVDPAVRDAWDLYLDNAASSPDGPSVSALLTIADAEGGLCLVVTGGLTTLLWGLLSGTGAVVEGPGAVLHVVVWTGFALFVGVFFGLIAETA